MAINDTRNKGNGNQQQKQEYVVEQQAIQQSQQQENAMTQQKQPQQKQSTKSKSKDQDKSADQLKYEAKTKQLLEEVEMEHSTAEFEAMGILGRFLAVNRKRETEMPSLISDVMKAPERMVNSVVESVKEISTSAYDKTVSVFA